MGRTIYVKHRHNNTKSIRWKLKPQNFNVPANVAQWCRRLCSMEGLVKEPETRGIIVEILYAWK